MQGLELAEGYFREVGAPLLARDFGSCAGRIAAGLVGYGSECFGFDDELSRDHDWGPGFCQWLRAQDHAAIGRRLQEAYERLPAVYAGLGPRRASPGALGRTGVMSIEGFYAQFTGLERVPATLQEWRVIPETELAACTNGKVFVDPLGDFSRRRKTLLAYYPEDVRLKKIAARCMSAGQSGQYNYGRCVRRGEYVAARYAETRFIADVIALVFHLNRRYRPFYKWMHRVLADLPLMGARIHALLDELVARPAGRDAHAHEARQDLMERLCRILVEALREEGLSDAAGTFLCGHGPEIQARISDPALRAVSVWTE